MSTFLTTLMDGLAVGSLYALIALGYTMVYGILKFINFAHSDVFVLGAWVSLVAATSAGLGDDGAGMQAISPWLLGVLWTLVVWGALMTAAERATRGKATGGVLAFGPARWLIGGGRATLVVGACGWGIIGLVVTARGLKGVGAPEWVNGGLVLVVAMATCAVAGFCIERLAYKPLRSAPRLNVLITAIGVSLLLQNLGQLSWMFGAAPRRMPQLVHDRVIATATFVTPAVGIRLLDVVCAGTAVVLMVLMDRLVFATKLGRAMRAVSFNERTAALMGIPVNRVISFTFVLGSALAAAAGFLYAEKYTELQQTAHTLWVLLGLKAFVAAVIGGIGNVRGAMLGGVLIGLLEFFTRAYIGTQVCDIVVFAALIVVLLAKPSGILGRSVQEKV